MKKIKDFFYKNAISFTLLVIGALIILKTFWGK